MAITDGRLKHDATENGWLKAIDQLTNRCAHLTAAGVDLVLLREKQLLRDRHYEELAWLCESVGEALSGTETRLLVAAPVEIAAALPVAGVHLGSRGDPLAARTALPRAFLSVSCHTVDEVRHAAAHGVDAILFAPVFGKWVDGVEVIPGVGLALLRQACEAAGQSPLFALGGVNEQNAAECVAAGAAGIAGIRMFF